MKTKNTFAKEAATDALVAFVHPAGLRRIVSDARAHLNECARHVSGADTWQAERALNAIANADEALARLLPEINKADAQITAARRWLDESDESTASPTGI